LSRTAWYRLSLRGLALTVAFMAGLVIPSVVGTSSARAADACSVDLFPTQQLGVPSGYEVGFRLACNFVISGYHVQTGDRAGAPRDSDGGPAIHTPSFSCSKSANDPAQGFVDREFFCRHYSYPATSPSSLSASGWWQVRNGAPACTAPRLRWTIEIYGAAGQRLRKPVDIRCTGSPPRSSPRPPTPPGIGPKGDPSANCFVRIVTSWGRVRQGAVKIRLASTGPGACEGRLRLDALVGSRARHVAIGSRRFSMGPRGASSRVKVRLSSKGRSFLRRRKNRLSTSVNVLVPRSGGGTLKLAERIMVIKR
jgi:hypothetical protein